MKERNSGAEHDFWIKTIYRTFVKITQKPISIREAIFKPENCMKILDQRDNFWRNPFCIKIEQVH